MKLSHFFFLSYISIQLFASKPGNAEGTLEAEIIAVLTKVVDQFSTMSTASSLSLQEQKKQLEDNALKIVKQFLIPRGVFLSPEEQKEGKELFASVAQKHVVVCSSLSEQRQ